MSGWWNCCQGPCDVNGNFSDDFTTVDDTWTLSSDAEITGGELVIPATRSVPILILSNGASFTVQPRTGQWQITTQWTLSISGSESNAAVSMFQGYWLSSGAPAFIANWEVGVQDATIPNFPGSSKFLYPVLYGENSWGATAPIQLSYSGGDVLKTVITSPYANAGATNVDGEYENDYLLNIDWYLNGGLERSVTDVTVAGAGTIPPICHGLTYISVEFGTATGDLEFHIDDFSFIYTNPYPP